MAFIFLPRCTSIDFCVGRLDSTIKMLYFSCIDSKGFGTPFGSLFAEFAYPESGATRLSSHDNALDRRVGADFVQDSLESRDLRNDIKVTRQAPRCGEA